MSVSDKQPKPETPLQRLERLRSEFAGKDIISMPLAKGSGHLVMKPDLVREVWGSRNFVRPPFIRKAFGEGLLFSDGDRWTHSRRSIQPKLTPKCVHAHKAQIEHFSHILVSRWKSAAGTQTPVQFVEDIAGFVFQTTMGTLFGIDVDPLDPKSLAVIRLTAACNELAGLGVFDPRVLIKPDLIKTLQTERNHVEDLVHQILSQREGSITDDLLSTLMQPDFIDADIADAGCPVGHDGLVSELVLLLLASVETTTTSIANTFELLSTQPQSIQLIREEYRTHGCAAEYTTSCFKESLRIRPPVWFNGRVATQGITLSNQHEINEGDHVYICPYLLHRDPKLWSNPDDFLPSRFTTNSVKEGPYYLPFGLGRHYCVGAGFATMLGTTLISKVLQNIDIHISTQASNDPGGGFLLGPALDSKANLDLLV